MDQLTRNSPSLDFSEPEERGNKHVLESYLLGKPDLSIETHLEDLKSKCKQQLEDLELQHHADLEKRLLQNSVLTSRTDSILKVNTSQQISFLNRSKTRKNYSSPTPTKAPGCSGPGTERQRKPLPQDSQKAKEEADLAECRKQFRVVPVPKHVSKSLYEDLVHDQERLRRESREQRRNFLLTMQKPFIFNRERLKEETTSLKKTETVQEKKQILTAVSESRLPEPLKAPVKRQDARADRVTRCAEKTKGKMLGFLDQKLSFKPKINSTVPDFDKLFQAFQQQALETAEKRDITRCKPFHLRTATLQPRTCSPENTESSTEKQNLRRSRSVGGLTSLSMDTLPTYITDAARKRSMAVRRSLELKDLNEQENAEWMKQHRIRSQAMSSAVAVRAKAMDPHKTLKEVYQDKLKQNRQAEVERMRDYQRELKEIKTRVTARPYLFEQISQKNAKNNAERQYKNTLERAGFNESFFESKAERNTAVHVDEDHYSTDTETQKSAGRGEDSVLNEEEKEGNVETKEEESC